jgi:hypothetical protein
MTNREKKTIRQRELRRLNHERYRQYDRTPERVFSKQADNAKRKFMVLRMIKGDGEICCSICKEKDVIKLTIDHVDESGSEANLYQKLLAGLSNISMKQVLCYNCNSVLRVLGHDNPEKAKQYAAIYNEGLKRAILNGIPANVFVEMTEKRVMELAGISVVKPPDDP